MFAHANASNASAAPWGGAPAGGAAPGGGGAAAAWYWGLQPGGAGYLVALAQVSAVYYLGSALLAHVLPALLDGARRRGAGPGTRWLRAPGQDARRDALRSAGPLAVKALAWSAAAALHRAGRGRLYAGPVGGADHALYLLACWVALDYLHDAWFYWTHRLLHHPWLLRRVHYVHHQSTVPTAFSGYSFHVAEAALVFLNEVLVCFLFPIHIKLHRVYHLFTTVIHCGGHAGYELQPFIPSVEQLMWFALRGARLAKGLNTILHHDMHHQFPNKHFSLYFTHWDYLCGTMHGAYEPRARALSRAFRGEGTEGGAGGKRE